MISRREALIGSLAAAGFAAGAKAQTPPPVAGNPRPLAFADPTETIDLWPQGAPGAPARLPVETVLERSTDPAFNDRTILGISRPRMAVFRPREPNGAAVLITPGGGYSWVVVDKEGYEMARLLAAQGVTAFVLFYRLPHEGWAAGPDTPLSDAQRAIRLIRHRAATYRVDPAKVCAMGFSAGGHLCADLLTRFDVRTYQSVDAADRLSARPDLAAPIYPVISMTRPIAHEGSRRNLIGADASPERERAHAPHEHVSANCPPTFLLHAEDDRSVVVENTLLLRAALRDRGVATETHLVPTGGHGFGLRLARGTSAEGWPDIFFAWCHRNGLWRT